MKLDKGKIEALLLNQGLSTNRSKKLADKLCKSDVFSEDELPGKIKTTEKSEVVTSKSDKTKGG